MKATVLKILVSSAMFLLPGSTVFAQGDQSVSADLDGDGKPDKFRIKADKLQYQLSTQKNITRSSKPLDIEGLNNSVSVVKNVVAVSLSAMRSGMVFKLRYDNTAGDLRIIGYDSENFGPASNDGSGKSSHNLLTGDYVANWNHFDEQKEKLVALPTIKKKSPAKKYYLAKFDDNAIEEIRSVDDKFLPAVLK